jgi:crossover junction endodeoxyribonuclease RuvC
LIIVGIDPGTLTTGYGVIQVDDRGIIKVIDYGCVKPPAKLKLTDRYLILFNAVESLFDKFKPSVLAIETQYVKNNVQSAIKLGMARGIVVVAAKKRGLGVFEYAPSKAKIAVVGNGSASKQQVQGMVKALLGLSVEPPEDAADALALAMCHANSLRWNQLCAAEI